MIFLQTPDKYITKRHSEVRIKLVPDDVTPNVNFKVCDVKKIAGFFKTTFVSCAQLNLKVQHHACDPHNGIFRGWVGSDFHKLSD